MSVEGVRRRMRWPTLTVLACACVALALAASGSAGTTKPSGSTTMAVSIEFHNPWLDPYGKELARIGKKNGIPVTLQYADGTTQNQASQIDTILAQHPSILLYTLGDANAATAILAKIKQAGIPVLVSIIQPTSAGMKYATSYYGPNDFIQGELNAKALASYLVAHGHKCGEVAILRGLAGGTDNTDRAAGFRAALKKADSCLKIVADQNTDWQSDPVAYNVASAVLRQHPQVVGILTEADTIAAGAAKAVAALHLQGKVAVTGLGGSCQGFALLKQHKIVADTLQDPVLGADGAFKLALRIVHHQSFKKVEYMALPVLTPKNVSKYSCHW